MEIDLSQSDNQTKDMLIEQLISLGIFKIRNYQLFELSLKDLLDEWNKYHDKMKYERDEEI